MSVLHRLPPLATTGVGSLPFSDPAEAVRHARRAYALPFCPQLPQRDGDMVREWLGSDPCRCGWTPERDRELPTAWHAFLATREDEWPEHRVVKLQVTGPVTLAVALEQAAGRPGIGTPVRALAREIADWLAANVAGQVAGLREHDLDAVVVVDEPGLAHAVGGGLEAEVWDPLRAVGAAWGLHVCSAVPWELVRAADPDLVSFDATRYAVGGAGASVLGDLISRGARVAWGVVDPVDPGHPDDVAACLSAAIGAVVAAGVPVSTVFAHSLVTPSCGTGRLAPDRERLVAALVEAGAAVAASTWRGWPAAADPRRAGLGDRRAGQPGGSDFSDSLARWRG